MFNRYIIDSDTFQNLHKRRAIRRKLAKQMIINSHSAKLKTISLPFVAILFGFYIYIIHANLPLG